MMRMVSESALMMTVVGAVVGCEGNYAYNTAVVASDTIVATVANAFGTAIATLIFGA